MFVVVIHLTPHLLHNAAEQSDEVSHTIQDSKSSGRSVTNTQVSQKNGSVTYLRVITAAHAISALQLLYRLFI